MRSKLETRWARLFDQIGWPWAYEQVVTDGYIPDFALGNVAGGLLAEIKPERQPGELLTYVPKVTRGLNSIDYVNPFVILGGDPDLYTGRGFISPGLYLEHAGKARGLDTGDAWLAAPAAWIKCLGCGNFGVGGFRLRSSFKPCGCGETGFEVLVQNSFAHARIKSAFRQRRRR